MALTRVSALVWFNGQAGSEGTAESGSRQSNPARPVK
jgi:hypothetical protein